MTVESLGRAIQLYRRTSTSRSELFLVVANAIPLVGVLFFGWSLLTILVLYWLENGIVGFWNIPKINLARGALASSSFGPAASEGTPAISGSSPLLSAARLGLSIFFLFHYGLFWLVHGIFIFALPMFMGGGGRSFGVDPGSGGGAFGDVAWSSVLIGGVALFISHGASFLFNYIGRGEYLTASPSGQMAAVYGRVVVLHLTIIFGAFLVAALGAPIGALLVFVALKTVFDLALHLRERRRADSRFPPSSTFGKIVRGEPPAAAGSS